ncbi:MAG: hypothetical protein ISN29_02105 [Gammaproteobacteria bacterium AqS3]|nr:hypothetical protein [Gammaproteobacteria bacterium AqS3]
MPATIDRNANDHEKLSLKLDVIHEDIKRVLDEVSNKYDSLKDELNEQRIARVKLEGRMDLIQKTSNENEALWKKVIYSGIGFAVVGVLAGLAKIGGAW